MPQVASETPVQSHSLPPTRASSARSSQANAGTRPFESLIDDSPALPPPAKDQGSPSKTARQDKAEVQDQHLAAAKPPKPPQETRTDKPAENDGADDGKTKSETAEGGDKAAKAAKPAETARPAKTAGPTPPPAAGQPAGKSDDKPDDKTDAAAGTGDTDKPAGATADNGQPAAPDPTAAQAAAQQASAAAQAQAPATTGTIVAAAAQAAATPETPGSDGDTASPKAQAVLTALSGIAGAGGPAARLSARAGHPGQAAEAAQDGPQAQTPDSEAPGVQKAQAGPQPQPGADDAQKAAEQKLIAAARGEKPADVQRAALPDPAGPAGTSAPNTSAQPATTATPNLNINVPNPANQPAPQATAASATPPAPPPPSAPVPLAGVAVAIAARASAGKNDFSIRLDPPELGRVDVRLSVDKDGKITSHLVADRRDTLALLQRDASGLQRALQDAGFKTGDNGLQFSLRDSFVGQQQQQQQQANGGNAGHIVLNDETPGAEAIPGGYGRYLGRVGGVDIRV